MRRSRVSRPVRYVLAAAVVCLTVIVGSPAAAAPGDFEVTPVAIEFGDVAVGSTSAPILLMLKNTSGATRTVHYAGGAAFDNANFDSVNVFAEPTVLADGESVALVEYAFHPTVAGRIESGSNVTITADEAPEDEDWLEITISGGVVPSSDPVDGDDSEDGEDSEDSEDGDSDTNTGSSFDTGATLEPRGDSTNVLALAGLAGGAVIAGTGSALLIRSRRKTT